MSKQAKKQSKKVINKNQHAVIFEAHFYSVVIIKAAQQEEEAEAEVSLLDVSQDRSQSHSQNGNHEGN